MLEVTNQAVELLKAAKSAQGAPHESGIRIRRAASERPDTIAVGFVVSEQPQSGDDVFERDGLRFFIEDSLVRPLDGRTLDVSYNGEMVDLVFR